MQPQTILDSIDTLPRIKLARLNTPFEEMPRLRAAIAESMETDADAVPRLFIKRDDTTGFAFGGNKARHMEFLFAHLIERGIDTIVNINHYDSNNARLVAASCAKTGMKCHLVAYDMVDAPVAGNLLIAHLAGAEIHRVPEEHARSLAEKLLAEEIETGRSATILSDNPFFDIAGMIGFLETGSELDAQIANFLPPSHLPSLHPLGEVPKAMGAVASEAKPQEMPGAEERSGCPRLRGKCPKDKGGPSLANTPLRMWGLCGRSIAGIRLYARNTGKNWSASATAQPHHTPETYEATYIDRSTRVAKLLGLDTALEPGDIDTITGYSGSTYGVPTETAFEAIHLVAKTEGIILDPNYTGKSMSALIAQIRTRNLDPEVPVVFIHSGGQPQTFAFPDELWEWNPNPPLRKTNKARRRRRVHNHRHSRELGNPATKIQTSPPLP